MSRVDPTAEEIAEMTILAAEEIQPLRHRAQGGAAVAFGFRLARFAKRAEDARGGGDPEAHRARPAVRRRNAWRYRAVGNAAPARLSRIRSLKGEANLLVFPNLDAANITLTALQAR